ncbi:glycosyltransferase family 2 protein [Desulfuromonas sp. KJ2020]|uniref:glycosyltransferase family 2 protein n=1 Tax=Desulfuromonas sp. KJ2020 TaxID=2919173 RepID=UPI0020A7CF2D|nr:glycosyltransferase family 2 protein [Desulfuromonas sp. KJ2020]MCP3175629.1 glycosyltransferase family 2 protein [Desulfuromonas sp. KJ2020]
MDVALMDKVSIIIVNWNGRNHLATCLDSLAAQSFKEFEVVLVDNGSIDGSVEFVRHAYPWVRLVELPENTGFAAGNNLGFNQARGEYIVTLNNDTQVEPDWLELLVQVADDHPHAGMVGCRICSFTNPDVIDSLGLAICKDGMSRGRFRNRLWSSLNLPAVEDILIPSACAALYRRAMLESVGFFDADFFAYAEDTDLGLRGRLAGWGAVIATGAVVYHKYSQTSGSLSPFKVYLVERNHFWVVLKNFPLNFLVMLPFFTVWRYLEQAQAVLASRGTGGEFRDGDSRVELVGALLKGIWDSLRGMPQVLRKRRQLMQMRKLTGREYAQLLRHHGITFKELLDMPAQAASQGDAT